MVGSVVILTESFLDSPKPCFGYIYGSYENGYYVAAIYNKKWLGYDMLSDLGGFSIDDFSKYTIPYTHDSHSYHTMLNDMYTHIKSNKHPKDGLHSINTDGLLRINLREYFDNNDDERVSIYIRDYTIDQIIGNC